MKQQTYRAGLYLRLSRDDAAAGDSSSIQTQRTMLEDYCREQGIPVFDTYIDDGYTGLNFDRPAFQRLLGDIQNGLVNLVMTKDLSRLGRDYIQTGHYTEVFFPSHCVRYIALNDGVDTLYDNNDIAPFKNILNDMYARDLSRKVKSAKRARAAQGAFIGSHPPYGYQMSEASCNVLEVDEDAAAVIRRIFHMAVGGMGAVGIAKALREEKILTPSAYKVSRGDTRFAHLFAGRPEEKKYRWAYTTVHRILGDRVYLGAMVGHKSQVLSYKTKRIVPVPEAERIVVEGTHPPLVSEEHFQLVQRLIKARHQPLTVERANLFRGFLYCDECGHRLSMATKAHAGVKTPYYRCMHHYHCPGECTGTHYLRYDDLYQIVWQDFQRFAALLSGRAEVLVKLLHETDCRHKEQQRRLAQNAKLKGRLTELEGIINKLFEDGAAGRISPQNHRRMMEQYQQEQESVQQELDARTRDLSAWENPAAHCRELGKVIRKHLTATELNPWLVGDLIEKIHVGQAYKTGDGKEQNIRIEYRFAGELPALAEAAESLEQAAAIRGPDNP